MSANKQLLAAVRSLTAEIQKMKIPAKQSTGGQPKRRKRRSRKNKQSGLGPARITGSGSGSSDVVITKTELVATIKVEAGKDTNSGKLAMTTGGDLPWLKVMANSFERSLWRSLRAEYRPACAMTQAGRFTMGFDWDWSGEATDRTKISAYQPNCGGVVFQACSLSVPLGRGPQKWYYAKAADGVNKGPGELVWAVESAATEATVMGEIWITYTVVLSGPRA